MPDDKHHKKPIIGIITRVDSRDNSHELPQYTVLQQYVKALTRFGVSVILIPPQDSRFLAGIFGVMDGMLLAGGGDIDPVTTDRVSRAEHTRDTAEIELTHKAFYNDLPVLGICRGLQIINVALGGTLYKDISLMRPGSLNHTSDWRSGRRFVHSIEVVPGTRLSGLIKGQEIVQVNGNHHQAIQTLASDLRISSVAPDGIVESVECKSKHYLLAVQWHPEWMLDFDDKLSIKIFSSFAGAAFEYAGLKIPLNILSTLED